MRNIVLFVNDSFFAHHSAKSIIEQNGQNISLIVFSKSKSQRASIIRLLKNVSTRYLFYRGFIHFLSKSFLKKRTVRFLAKKYAINTVNVTSRDDLYKHVGKSCAGFAINFDLILDKEILNRFSEGVFNIHASKLPKDRGISPALWSYARGDLKIWSTIYKMDEGIDTGKIYKQIYEVVNEKDSFFSLYKRICSSSGEYLNSVYTDIKRNQLVLTAQNSKVLANYLSWPDENFDRMMKKSKRRLLSLANILIS